MGASLREEMISLSLFGGRLALAELILFSVFLTDILLLGIMGEINLSGVLLANAAFVLCYVTALGFLQGALALAAQRFEAGDRGGYIPPSLRCRCCLAAGWRCCSSKSCGWMSVTRCWLSSSRWRHRRP